MLLHPHATNKDHGGPRTSDLSIEKLRRNQFTTAPKNMEAFDWKFIQQINKKTFFPNNLSFNPDRNQRPDFTESLQNRSFILNYLINIHLV